MRSRSRSRSPISRNSSFNSPRSLQICNFPRSWDFVKIKDFLRSTSNDSLVSSGLQYVDVLKDQGSCIVRFNSLAAALKCLKACYGIILEDKKLDVQLCDISNTPPCKNTVQNVNDNNYSNNNNSQPQNNQQQQPVDSFETYGLSHDYLTSLRIKPPLVNRIFVNNLDPRVDEEKLHEVFSMAGTITFLVLIKKHENTEKEKMSAKIVYDHPVEAVQAVAMLHNQILYDRRILTRLDFISKGPVNKLPDHLENVGKGLGHDGGPLKNVRLHLEIIALKQELNSKLDMLFQQNQSMRQMLYNANASTSNQILSNMNMDNMNLLNNPNNQLAVNPMLQNAMTPNNMQVWAGLMQNPLALAMQAQSDHFNSTKVWKFGNKIITKPAYVQENMVGSNRMNLQYGSTQGNQEHNSRRAGDDRDKVFIDDNMDLVDMRSTKEGDDREAELSDMLPTNVSFRSLKAKMGEVGDVRFVELTGQGRALVRFNSVLDCKRCKKKFHLSRVDGQTIHVNYC